MDNPSPKIDIMSGLSYHPSLSRTIYSDRFIPSRSSSNFALFHINSSSPNPTNPTTSDGRDDTSVAYTSLSRMALFGSDLGFGPPGTPEKLAGKNSFSLGSPSRNIFRFKSETRQSLPPLLPFGSDDQLPGVSHNPVKAPRKIPRSPYKVLDAPPLQDDFYRLRVGALAFIRAVFRKPG